LRVEIEQLNGQIGQVNYNDGEWKGKYDRLLVEYNKLVDEVERLRSQNQILQSKLAGQRDETTIRNELRIEIERTLRIEIEQRIRT
jgi:hypothetical protein